MGSKPKENIPTEQANVFFTSNSQDQSTSNRHRPIKFVIDSPDDQFKVVKQAKHVRQVNTDEYNPKTVFLVPDQTKLERKQDIILRNRAQGSKAQMTNMSYEKVNLCKCQTLEE